jgi:hypothetical protein
MWTYRGALVVGGVDAGAGLEQEFAGGLVAGHDGVVKGITAAVALEVDVGPAVEEQLHHLAAGGLALTAAGRCVDSYSAAAAAAGGTGGRAFFCGPRGRCGAAAALPLVLDQLDDVGPALLFGVIAFCFVIAFRKRASEAVGRERREMTRRVPASGMEVSIWWYLSLVMGYRHA